MTLTIERLRCQVPDGVLAIGAEPVRLSWRLTADGLGTEPNPRQLGYRIDVAHSPTFDELLATTGEVEDDEQVAVVTPGGPLASREVRHIRVRIRDDAGWSPWSDTLTVEAGLLDVADWVAAAITQPDDPGAHGQSPSPLLRREFDVPSPIARARLHVTALGLHHVRINGRPVTEDLLEPGWTTYHHRLLADTYDVTGLLRSGPNAIAGILGDGWYRGRLGWLPGRERGRYGEQVGLIAQLEIEATDGRRSVIATDADWRASTGEIRSADLYDGCDLDLRQRQPGWDEPDFDDRAWLPVAVVPFDATLVEPRMAPPVRVVDRLPVEPTRRGDGCWMLDGGQNVSGWVRLSVRGKAGDTVTVRHAEVLEPSGDLHTRSLRSARATDTYVLADDEVTVLEPMFTFHGFRYAEVETTASLIDAHVVAISSDTPVRGSFACSDEALNRLHLNVLWSQRDNFVSVPTDCPQRDERLGWTGDAQAFANTASVLFDAEAFWRSWLRDLALDQDAALGVSTVVPDVVIAGEPRYGRAGWADAATIVPWSVVEAYGDPIVLADQLESMVAWLESLEARRGPDGLLPSSMQFGDWLDPDAPSDRPWEAKADSTYIANAFLVHSARLTADAARRFDDGVLERRAQAIADDVATKTWDRWHDHAITTQTGCAIAIELGIAPEIARSDVAATLARLVRAANGRVATGFLGTPLVLPALVRFGYLDECYQMLLRREDPSWLYQVSQGATTVWERWDAIRPDGSIHPGTMSPPPDMTGSKEEHMLSFNHYAYGAVIDWVYRHLAGIAPDRDRPGYRHVLFAPKPCAGIDWARASVDSAYGVVASDWRLEARGLAVRIDLPIGTSGTFVAPITAGSIVSLDGEPVDARVDIGPGRHNLLVTDPARADPTGDRKSEDRAAAPA
jgi:alpha-L-rhamnosidase